MSREQERSASDYNAYDSGLQSFMSSFDFVGSANSSASSSSNQLTIAGPHTVDLGSVEMKDPFATRPCDCG